MIFDEIINKTEKTSFFFHKLCHPISSHAHLYTSHTDTPSSQMISKINIIQYTIRFMRMILLTWPTIFANCTGLLRRLHLRLKIKIFFSSYLHKKKKRERNYKLTSKETCLISRRQLFNLVRLVRDRNIV